VPHLPVAEPAQARVDTMATKGGRLPVPLEQSTTRREPCPNHKPISDIELVERYCSIRIHDKLARTGAMRAPNLRHLVALYNMYERLPLGNTSRTLNVHELTKKIYTEYGYRALRHATWKSTARLQMSSPARHAMRRVFAWSARQSPLQLVSLRCG
jgi:hypothetical protein